MLAIPGSGASEHIRTMYVFIYIYMLNEYRLPSTWVLRPIPKQYWGTNVKLSEWKVIFKNQKDGKQKKKWMQWMQVINLLKHTYQFHLPCSSFKVKTIISHYHTLVPAIHLSYIMPILKGNLNPAFLVSSWHWMNQSIKSLIWDASCHVVSENFKPKRLSRTFSLFNRFT